MSKILAALSSVTALAISLCTLPQAHAAKIPAQTTSSLTEDIQVQFDSRSRQTRITGRAASGQCFFLTLPQEWHATTGGTKTHLKSASSEAELTVNLRPAHELRGLPQADLASRDAAVLQQDYESLLGRPAQSVSLAFLTAQAMRWSATWIDANLPSGPMTVEAFIVPMSEDWVLEISFAHVAVKEEYKSLVHSLLTGLELRPSGGCGDRLVF